MSQYIYSQIKKKIFCKFLHYLICSFALFHNCSIFLIIFLIPTSSLFVFVERRSKLILFSLQSLLNVLFNFFGYGFIRMFLIKTQDIQLRLLLSPLLHTLKDVSSFSFIHFTSLFSINSMFFHFFFQTPRYSRSIFSLAFCGFFQFSCASLIFFQQCCCLAMCSYNFVVFSMK